ncbi:hypothetical protein N0V93_004151 [Gnomoniopsis smithogilvyi]|uniref:ATP-dependent RNA helicase n=1 Tax=Gnomoniopsis smithogilvyi TaxID=1191159 RepID=A0A9W8YS41_9PEZI|nr:hypothetical protein N0V93_004151 [Gnomoniopsis smithogilvyi]
MFKRQLLRQARATRALRVAPSSLSSFGVGAAPRPSTTYRPALLANSICRNIISRSYSSASAEASSQNEKTSGLITRFADLSNVGVHANLLRSIVNDMRYENMTDVQAMSINPALSGKDIVAQARTGTGKTLGFLLPTVQRIIQADPELSERSSSRRARSDDIRAIIISPTRELAEQIGEEARRLCRHTGVVVQTAVGGMNKGAMLRKTKFEGCHLLVGTPGRLMDLLSDDYSGIDAPNLSALCLDEADRMLDVGFEKELHEIVSLLPNRREKPRQTMLFSATIPKNVVSLARTYVDANNFQFVQTINPDEAPTHERVPQHIVPVPGYEHWLPALLEIMEKAQAGEHGPDPFKAIAFFNNTDTVKLVGELFEYLPRHFSNLPPAYVIHSGLDQRQRTRAADSFRRAKSGLLISTDVTARGMDFPNVTHVIQFGSPPARDQYIHRIGRTGRANKSGQAWLIVRKDEIPDARRVLPGLPIKRNDTLEVAKVDTTTTSEDALPQQFKAISGAMRRVHPHRINDAYVKLACDKRRDIVQSSVDSANHWVQFQCGLKEIPMIPERVAAGNGMTRLRNVNIGDRPRRGGYGEDRDFGGRGGRGGRGSGGGWGGGDAFSNLRPARDDGRGSRNRQAAF